MSTSIGCVKFQDGEIFYTTYQNTADIMHSCLCKRMEDLDSIQSQDRKCHCKKGEKVMLATNYGGGFSWSGIACKRCLVIIEGHSPVQIDGLFETVVPAPDIYIDGLPDWWPL